MRCALAAVVFVVVLGVAGMPARADVVVLGSYTLVNGDTLTRASYFTSKRVRATAPDGREFLYDAKAKKVMIVDHRSRSYWRGPIERADSLASVILAQRGEELRPKVEANREQVMARLQALNDSLRVFKTDETRTIAGYPCTKWVLSAGSTMTHERWVARGLDVADYSPELDRVIQASILDPLGRVLMRQLLAMRSQDGLPLAATTTFNTFTQSGGFSWQAISAVSAEIPKSVWEAPKGYHRIER